MCGLISVIGKISTKEEKIFKQGLIVDVLRGEHSTGIAATKRGKDGETLIAKQVGNPFELFNDKRFDKAMGGWNRVLIGHNRYATQGAINKYNAHPYEFWPIYGAHNGTLIERHGLEENNRFSVDSQALYNHISEKGLEDAISNVRGAWALTWWNEDLQTFNVLRNKERTLFMTKDKDSDVMYFCSEAEMLTLILNRNGVKYEKITMVPEDTWLAFPISPEGEISKPRSKVVKGKEAPVYKNNQQNKYLLGNKKEEKKDTVIQGFNSDILRKDVLMAILEEEEDTRGIKYLSLRDVKYPLEDIRVYPGVGKFEFQIGDVVIANIHHFVSVPERYYRINPDQLRKSTTEQQVEYDKLEAELFANGTLASVIEEQKEEPKLYDHRGYLLSKSEWEKKYPNCDWCTSDIDPDDAHNFLSKGGNILCPSCSKDPSVTQWVA